MLEGLLDESKESVMIVYIGWMERMVGMGWDGVLGVAEVVLAVIESYDTQRLQEPEGAASSSETR